MLLSGGDIAAGVIDVRDQGQLSLDEDELVGGRRRPQLVEKASMLGRVSSNDVKGRGLQHGRGSLEGGAANAGRGAREHGRQPLMVAGSIALVALNDGREIDHIGGGLASETEGKNWCRALRLELRANGCDAPTCRIYDRSVLSGRHGIRGRGGQLARLL